MERKSVVSAAAQASSSCPARNCSNGVSVLLVINLVVIGNGDYNHERRKCTAEAYAQERSGDLLGPRASRPLSLNATETDLNDTFKFDLYGNRCGRDARGPSTSLDRSALTSS